MNFHEKLNDTANTLEQVLDIFESLASHSPSEATEYNCYNKGRKIVKQIRRELCKVKVSSRQESEELAELVTKKGEKVWEHPVALDVEEIACYFIKTQDNEWMVGIGCVEQQEVSVEEFKAMWDEE